MSETTDKKISRIDAETPKKNLPDTLTIDKVDYHKPADLPTSEAPYGLTPDGRPRKKPGPKESVEHYDIVTVKNVPPEAVQESIESLKPLSPKEKAFVHHYLNNGYVATKAAKSAGYTARNEDSFRVVASTVFSRKNVSRAIELGKRDVETRLANTSHLNRQWVLDKLAQIVITAMEVKAIKKAGKAIVQYQPQAAVRALELIGKEVAGMFVDRTADVTDQVRERERHLLAIKEKLESYLSTKTTTN